MKKLLLSNTFKLLFLILLTNNIINAQVIPTFPAVSPICSGGTLSPLPTTSNNVIVGSWAPALNNLLTTTYTFTPTAGQNANATTLTVTVNPLPTIASFSTSTNFVCTGTKGTMNFTGTPNSTVVYTDGTSTFSVLLNATGSATIQTPNNLNSATTFSLVSITNNLTSCSNTSLFSTVPVTIQISTLPVITAQPQTTTICEGSVDAVLSVIATGSSLTYVWKKGLSIVANSNSNTIVVPSNLSNTGIYTCTVTDACGQSVTSNQASLIINDAPIMIAAAMGGTFCSGTTINLAIATTGTGLTYKWKRNGVDLPTTNLTATTSELVIVNAQTTDSGDYTCVAKSGTCSVISPIATIVVTAINSTTNLVGSTITANQANATYEWIDCVNGNATIVGQNSQSFTPTTNGQYAVNIQYNNCISTSQCITIDFLEVDNFKNTSNIQLFPNPTASILNIQTQEKIIDLKIIDITGRTTNVSNYANHKIDVSNLSSGMYFVAIKTQNGLFKEKFIKK